MESVWREFVFGARASRPRAGVPLTGAKFGGIVPWTAGVSPAAAPAGSVFFYSFDAGKTAGVPPDAGETPAARKENMPGRLPKVSACGQDARALDEAINSGQTLSARPQLSLSAGSGGLTRKAVT